MTEQQSYPYRKLNLPHPEFLNCRQTTVRISTPEPLYSHARMLNGLLLWRSCAGKDGGCEFMNSTVLSYPEDTVLFLPPQPVDLYFFCPSSVMAMTPKHGVCGMCPTCTHPYLLILYILTNYDFYINHSSVHKETSLMRSKNYSKHIFHSDIFFHMVYAIECFLSNIISV